MNTTSVNGIQRYFGGGGVSKDKSFRTFDRLARFKDASSLDVADEDGSSSLRTGGGIAPVVNDCVSNDEARVAEEALLANIRLLKKQKARFIRLQNLLSRNVFLTPLCVLMSFLAAFFIIWSTIRDDYEFIAYNISTLVGLVHTINGNTLVELTKRLYDEDLTLADISMDTVNRTTVFAYLKQNWTRVSKQLSRHVARSPALADTLRNIRFYEMWTNSSNTRVDYHVINSFALLTRPTSATTSTSTLTSISSASYELFTYATARKTAAIASSLNEDREAFVTIFEIHTGIWQLCNTLSEESRKQLGIDQCTVYRNSNVLELDRLNGYLHIQGRDILRMHNAAACCLIICYLLLACSWITGPIAIVYKKVPFTLSTSVLNFLICVFLALLLAVFHRKIYLEDTKSDCKDVGRTLMALTCQCRTIKFGFSLGLAWLALLFAFINGVCWFYVTKIQKLLFIHGFNHD